MVVTATSWTPDPHYYDFGRPFPYRHVLTLFKGSAAVRTLPESQRLQVFEPGSGTGRIIIPLACEFPHWHFTAVDAAPSMLDVLRHRAVCESLNNVTITQSDVATFIPQRPVDVVIVSSLLHAVREWRELLSHLVDNLTPAGMICIIGEEGDIYNEALGRRSELLPHSKTDRNLSSFWEMYLSARGEVGAPAPEQTQVGCPWEIQNEMPVSKLQQMGFSEIGGNTVQWSHCLRIRDLLKIVQERCYSSMFSIAPTMYEKLLGILQDSCRTMDHDGFVESRHVAVARFMTRS